MCVKSISRSRLGHVDFACLCTMYEINHLFILFNEKNYPILSFFWPLLIPVSVATSNCYDVQLTYINVKNIAIKMNNDRAFGSNNGEEYSFFSKVKNHRKTTRKTTTMLKISVDKKFLTNHNLRKRQQSRAGIIFCSSLTYSLFFS